MTLPFAAVAFDMDGTFLTDDKTFDHQLFNEVASQLRAQDVQLIVASGNSLECLLNYFTPEEQAELTFLSENGAHVVNQAGDLLISQTLDPVIAQAVIAYLVNDLHCYPSLAGTKYGYLPAQESPDNLERMKFYFPKYQVIDDYDHLPEDRYYQMSFLIDEQTETRINDLIQRFGDQVSITPSGNGSVDITVPGIDKAWALNHLLDQWQLSSDQLAAFGDGDNDLGMLKLAKYSYAMQNGNANVKAVANYQTKTDNNHNGVLQSLADYLG